MNPTGEKPLTIRQTMARHPAPWAYHTDPYAVVRVFDAKGVEVPMFVVLDLAVNATIALSTGKREEKPV